QTLAGIARICAALKQLDQLRNALRAAEDHLLSTINQPEIPQHVREEYRRFLRPGGCSFPQWREGPERETPQEGVKERGGLRLVVGNNARRRFKIGEGGGPRVA